MHPDMGKEAGMVSERYMGIQVTGVVALTIRPRKSRESFILTERLELQIQPYRYPHTISQVLMVDRYRYKAAQVHRDMKLTTFITQAKMLGAAS